METYNISKAKDKILNQIKKSKIVLFLILLFVSFFSPNISLAEDSLCAKVKMEIQQELTLERQAFDAHMRINNGLTDITLENVNISVRFTDENGAGVLASSDPNDPNPNVMFFIDVDSMENINDIGGSGTVAPSTSADIHWLIIPVPGASKGIPSGTLYYVGATLTYSMGASEEVTEVTPDYIFVKPMPQLYLDYFLPHDVYGDDAFTTQIEPPIPFTLGLRAQNKGYGTAVNLKIESAQPKITENEHGLLINFVINGTEINGAYVANSLLANFGNVLPNTSGIARWDMGCTLSGQFVEFNADYTHSDELGGELTSLIEEVNTHFLIHDVLVDLPGRDNIRDFLADDAGTYKVYETENVDTVVSNQSATLQLTGQTAGEVSYTLTTNPAVGFIYTKLSDPYNGLKILKRVVRSDGKILNSENYWLSKHRDGLQNWEYSFNLFDANTTGIYNITFDSIPNANNSPVLQFIPNYRRLEGQQVSFLVQSSDPDGTIPSISAFPLPMYAAFTDNGTGMGTFSWNIAPGQAGLYEIVFKSSDGISQDEQAVLITVSSNPADTILTVPGEFATIQAAINAAINGDTVLVSDGVYVENINFQGKEITVKSVNGAEYTAIDGNLAGSVVTFNSNEGSSSQLKGFAIQNGSANNGGGIYCLNSEPVIEECIIDSNHANVNGGGFYCENKTPKLRNCIFSDNDADDHGGAVYAIESNLSITNCTLSENTSVIYGGGIACSGTTTPVIVNTILWNNSAGTSGSEIYSLNPVNITYSDIQGGYDGIDNIDVDPLFAGEGDYHLQAGSLCINTGTAADVLNDLDNESRPQGNAYDIGADEVVCTINAYRDADSDGFGDPGEIIQACTATPGYVAKNTDCDDSDAGINPAADEVCEGIDNNCNGQIDEDVKGVYYFDADSDGFGDASISVEACTAPAGYVENNTDCDDSAPDINPNAEEICDDIDNNCNGDTDEGLTLYTYYYDEDGDGYGNPAQSILDCLRPDGYVTNGNDCDDLDTAINPGATEVCFDGIDNNCNGQLDENCVVCPVHVPDDFPTIQEAINRAPQGCDIIVRKGTYLENISIGKNITLRSEKGPDETILDGNNNGQVIVFNGENISAVLEGFTIQNGSGTNGAGIFIGGGNSPEIAGCMIKNNAASLNGGAVFADINSEPNITNCLIIGNNSANDGGGIYCNNSTVNITNSTLSANTSANNGGGLSSSGSTLTISNSIFWGNAAAAGNEIYPLDLNVSYSDIQGGYIGANNINANPLFIGGGNYHLGLNSPCIDSGNGSVIVDIDGNARPQNNSYDMGADEVIRETVSTPEGLSVMALPLDSEITFDSVITSGKTTLTVLNAGTNPPTGFNLISQHYYLSTTAAHSGVIEVCFTYDDTNLTSNQEDSIYLLHYASDHWEDVTSFIDIQNNLICAEVTSLDEFVIAYPSSLLIDVDGDGYDKSVDCNDKNPNINPGAAEVCDGIDNDCDGGIDEGVKTLYYFDSDSDGYGDPLNTALACSQPAGYVTNNNDCNDADPLLNPATVWFKDADGDSYSDGASLIQCTQPAGYYPADSLITSNGDCDDSDATLNPDTVWYKDMDGDGYSDGIILIQCLQPDGYYSASTLTAINGDCNDDDALLNPTTVWYKDTDGDDYSDGSILTQCVQPADYYSATSLIAVSGDCNDANIGIKPGVADVCDGVDNDCDANTADGSGEAAPYNSLQAGVCGGSVNSCNNGSWTDDYSYIIDFETMEVSCDSLDNDCDGSADEGLTTMYYQDSDSDGYGNLLAGQAACFAPIGYVTNSGDCNDTFAAINPGAVEICDGVDNDCNPATADGAGEIAPVNTLQAGVCAGSIMICSSGSWVDNYAVLANYQVTESSCDGLDNDCDGSVDEDVKTTYYQDSDSDTYGNASVSQQACSAPEGYVTNSSDCDDANASIKPGATEVCDGVDNDCNGQIDEGLNAPNNDNQTGVCAGSVKICNGISGWVNDYSGVTNYEATETICDSLDNDCDGSVDEGIKTAYYQDSDSDNYGNASVSQQACSVPEGYVTNSSDCDDANASIKPGATEVCDGADNNCDGQIDEGVKTTYYQDTDTDTYGNATVTQEACSVPAGYASNNLDCDDSNATIHPQAADVCDGIDNDCNPATADGSGEVAPVNTLQAGVCAGSVKICGDGSWIDNYDVLANYQVTESNCDGLDNDCDGSTDEGLMSVYYQDSDGDGFGNALATQAACTIPAGYVTNSQDCDDSNATVHPGAADICDGIDNDCNSATADGSGEASPNNTLQAGVCAGSVKSCTNGTWADNYSGVTTYQATETSCDGLDNDCDGQIDEGVMTVYYQDADSDGYGNSAIIQQACSAPFGYITDNTDCNDADSAIYPQAVEVCDGIDNDCDGLIDEGVQTTYYQDADADTYGNAAVIQEACFAPSGYVSNNLDCNDSNVAINPGTNWYLDADGDGYSDGTSLIQCTQPAGYYLADSLISTNGDCNDTDAILNPATVWYKDADGDDYSDGSILTQCVQPADYYSATSLIAVSGDCNDANIGIKPGVADVCDGVDNDCDANTADGSGEATPNNSLQAGVCAGSLKICSGGSWVDNYVVVANYQETETSCDSLDNDCDGFVDEGVKTTYYQDSDSDTYGNASVSHQACSAPGGYVANSSDCDDSTAAINPAASEVCDGVDNDCDSSTDEGLTAPATDNQTGVCLGAVKTCDGANGWINDYSGVPNYEETETSCDSLDNDCDGAVDEDVKTTYYQDSDADTYGNASVSQQACSAPAGYVTNSSDCDDTNAAIKPGATEVCDGVDNDCDGSIDAGLTTVYFQDYDSDGYGNAAVNESACSQSAGYVTDNSDCNDNNAAINPSVPEVCGGETVQSALYALKNVIIILPNEAFKNNAANRKTPLANKIDALISMINAAKATSSPSFQDILYNEAVEKLQEDIQSKMDGCISGSTNNDWITDCSVQTVLDESINEILTALMWLRNL